MLDAEEVEGMPKEEKESKMEENKRKPKAPVVTQLKQALVLECKRIKKELSETSFSAIWKDMMKDLRCAYEDIANVFRKKDKKKKIAIAPPIEGKVAEVKKNGNSESTNNSNVNAQNAVPSETGDIPPLIKTKSNSKEDHKAQQPKDAEYDSQIALLLEMGYSDTSLLKDLLAKAKGNVPLVIAWLVGNQKA
jgi:hypothetical protein